MRERPILFSAPMVRAIIDGRKTQTRRVVKPQWVVDHVENSGEVVHVHAASCPGYCDYGCTEQAPYGQPGDRLWVKETWQSAMSVDHFSPTDIAKRARDAGYSPWAPLRYLADGGTDNADVLSDFGGTWGKTRVSIHMPRWASRITLEVVSVRVERLQDISEADALAEGVAGPYDVGYKAYRVPDDSKPRYSSAAAAFEVLWDSINAKRAPWASNPFVWVVGFKRVAQEARAA